MTLQSGKSAVNHIFSGRIQRNLITSKQIVCMGLGIYIDGVN